MTPEEFRSLLDTYGADLTRWPHAQRSKAHRYMQDSADARDIFAEAQELDALLSMSEPVLSDDKRDNLLDSIMADLPEDVDDSIAESAKGSNRPAFSPAPKNFAQRSKPSAQSGLVGLLGEILIRPNVSILATCFACGILIGAGVHLNHQMNTTSVSSAYDAPVSVYDLQ